MSVMRILLGGEAWQPRSLLHVKWLPSLEARMYVTDLQRVILEPNSGG